MVPQRRAARNANGQDSRGTRLKGATPWEDSSEARKLERLR